MKRECETCIKRKTIYCPNYYECYDTKEMPHYQNRIMLLEENQKYKEVIDKIKEEINNNKYYIRNTRRDIKTRKLIIEHIETALISKNKILEILKEVE